MPATTITTTTTNAAAAAAAAPAVTTTLAGSTTTDRPSQPGGRTTAPAPSWWRNPLRSHTGERKGRSRAPFGNSPRYPQGERGHHCSFPRENAGCAANADRMESDRCPVKLRDQPRGKGCKPPALVCLGPGTRELERTRGRAGAPGRALTQTWWAPRSRAHRRHGGGGGRGGPHDFTQHKPPSVPITVEAIPRPPPLPKKSPGEKAPHPTDPQTITGAHPPQCEGPLRPSRPWRRRGPRPGRCSGRSPRSLGDRLVRTVRRRNHRPPSAPIVVRTAAVSKTTASGRIP